MPSTHNIRKFELRPYLDFDYESESESYQVLVSDCLTRVDQNYGSTVRI